MLYIGFSNYSNKLHANMFCNKYKHCAPITINKNSAVIYQFVHINKIVKIVIQKNDLKLLEHHGWKFIKYPKKIKQTSPKYCLTCVQFTKNMCGIKKLTIQTPFSLFKYLNKK